MKSRFLVGVLNPSGVHWMAFVADLHNKCIYIMDSLSKIEPPGHTQYMKNWSAFAELIDLMNLLRLKLYSTLDDVAYPTNNVISQRSHSDPTCNLTVTQSISNQDMT